jgi:ABC-type multidrug transport system fused ATPase/permease subunit
MTVFGKIMKRGLKTFKWSEIQSRGNTILHNQYLLYFIFIIAIGNFFYLMMSNDIVSLIIFILVGFLTAFFSKNMIVILCVAMAITNILKYGTDIQNVEGYKDASEEEEEDDDKNIPEEEIEDEPTDVDENPTKKKTTSKEGYKESSEDQSNIDLNAVVKEIDDISKTVKEEYINADDLDERTKTIIVNQKKIMDNISLLEPYINTVTGMMKGIKSITGIDLIDKHVDN